MKKMIKENGSGIIEYALLLALATGLFLIIISLVVNAINEIVSGNSLFCNQYSNDTNIKLNSNTNNKNTIIVLVVVSMVFLIFIGYIIWIIYSYIG